MAVTHLALLLAASMSTCCAWHLPALPAQHRAQYYVLHDDGAYKHGYDTGEGQWASAKADAANQVTGEWQSVDSAGQAVHWAYTAGVQGYVPVLGNAAAGSAHVVPIVATAKHVPVAPPTWKAPPVQAKHSVDAQAGTGDASYSFKFDAGDHSRQESSSKEGNVVGNYQFTAKDGVQRRVDYVAGKETGFVAKGDHLPVAPEVPAGHQAPVPQHVPVAPATKSWSHQASWGSSSSGNVPAPKATSSHSQAAASSQEHVANPDGSYQFQYVAEDHSRQESGDAKGSVVGSYQFKADDGQQRRVDYVAGKETGFVAKGDHLPVAPEVPAVPVPLPVPVAPAVKSWSHQAPVAPAAKSWSHQASWGSSSSGNVPAPKTTSTHGQAAASSQEHVANPDGSYQFQYVAEDHSRQESGDAKGSVVGSYQFKADDGQQRRVDYVAGKETGFVAKGDHLPVAPEVPALPVPHQVPVAPAAKSWSHQASWGSSSSGNVPAPKTTSTHGQAAAASQEHVANPDGSYQFQYVAEDHSRQESGDAKGSVVGSYQFKADDGQQRRVDYVAGKETGFVAKGDHLPVAPAVPSVPVVPAVKSWTSQTKQSSWSSTPTVGHVPVVSPHLQTPSWTASSGRGDTHGDGEGSKAFSYSYDAVLSAKQETSDEQGNVAGSFQFVDGAGQQRQLTYTVNGDEGFVAKGDHLPVAPEVPAVPIAQVPVAPETKSWSHQASWSSSSSRNVPAPKTTSTHSQAAASSQEHVANPDGSYQFQYVAEDHSRQESGDAKGSVVGSFQFKADDGQQRRVDYVAGKDTGFVAKGDHLPVAPEVPAVPVPHPVPVAPAAKSWSHQASWGSSSSGNVPAPKTTSTHSKAAASSQEHVANPDGSYKFQYVAEDHSRQESGDAKGSVVGSYQFKADDGQQRRVDYVAGKDTGFVAKGEHLPVAPEAPVGQVAETKSWTGQTAWSSGSDSVAKSSGSWSRQDEEVQGEVEQQEETSQVEDEQQKVEDQQVLQEDAAQRVKDEATAQAEAQALEAEQQANQALLQQQEAELQAQAALAQQETAQAQALAEEQNSKDEAEKAREEADRRREEARLAQEAQQRSVQDQQDVQQEQQGWNQDEQQVQQHWQQEKQVQQVQHKSAPVHSSGVAKSDGYSFSYETDTQAVQQQSGAGNSAQGSYSFVAPDDRQWRTVDWTAAAGTGFVTKGNHLPVAPLPQEPVAPVSWKESSAATSKSSTGGVKTSSHSVQTSHDAQDNGDGSYEYSYKTDSASKQEAADKDGSVKGSFSYHGPDGVVRTLDYTANDKEGFVAKGDHLPGSTSSGGHVSSWTTDAKTTGAWAGAGVKSSSSSSGSGSAWSGKANVGVKGSHASTGTSGQAGSWGAKSVHGSGGWGTQVGGGGVKSSSHTTTVTTGGHGSRPYAPLPVVKTPVVKHFPEVEVTRYLPPESPKKFGYSFEAKA